MIQWFKRHTKSLDRQIASSRAPIFPDFSSHCFFISAILFILVELFARWKMQLDDDRSSSCFSLFWCRILAPFWFPCLADWLSMLRCLVPELESRPVLIGSSTSDSVSILCTRSPPLGAFPSSGSSSLKQRKDLN